MTGNCAAKPFMDYLANNVLSQVSIKIEQIGRYDF